MSLVQYQVIVVKFSVVQLLTADYLDSMSTSTPMLEDIGLK